MTKVPSPEGPEGIVRDPNGQDILDAGEGEASCVVDLSSAPLGNPVDLADETRGVSPRHERFVFRRALWDDDEEEAVAGLTLPHCNYVQVWWVSGERGRDLALLMPMLVEPEWIQ